MDWVHSLILCILSEKIKIPKSYDYKVSKYQNVMISKHHNFRLSKGQYIIISTPKSDNVENS